MKKIVLIYFILFLLFLLWIWMLFYFLGEIIGGISGVIVASIGALLTCYAVKEFIDYWNFRRFLELSKNRYNVLEELISSYENVLSELNKSNETELNPSVRNSNIHLALKQFNNKLVSSDLKMVYKYMEYDLIVKVRDKVMSLKVLAEKDALNEIESITALEDMKEIYFIFNVNKKGAEEILTIRID
ncbi:hypothetical protein SFC55_25015 [Niallia taxi]|uniref:hypothetical protein n=1 Tax=Niallia taxi TaxID=2499688 RepID=UPI003982771B